MSDVLGGDFDPAAFREAYDRLNRPQFHPFTADNQDYLAYICLVLASGVRALDTVIADVHAGRLVDFAQFIGQVDAEVERLPSRLRPIHREIYAYVQGGDPTPFKAFRYTEYRTTVGRMGCMSDSTPARGLLKEEIVITQEVRKFALAWRDRGALLFGLSDKPDEASMPSAELMAQGYQPIHRTETHAVGE